MAFNRWLRHNAEYFLLVRVQQQIAARYGRTITVSRRGPKDWFFLSIFVPVYRRLPWRFRMGVLQRMPGSHRRTWTPRERKPLGPAV